MTAPSGGRVWRRCSCGASVFASARPADLAARITDLFDAEHHGPGHDTPGAPPAAELPGQVDLLDLLQEHPA